jgi:hypothetical protein
MYKITRAIVTKGVWEHKENHLLKILHPVGLIMSSQDLPPLVPTKRHHLSNTSLKHSIIDISLS